MLSIPCLIPEPDKLKMLIVDEADDILSRGFEEQIIELFKILPRPIQLVFSAPSHPPCIENLAGKLMENITLLQICVSRDDLFTIDPSIRHFFLQVENEEGKITALRDVMNKAPDSQAVLLTGNSTVLDQLLEKTKDEDLGSSLQGDKFTWSEQEKRMKTIEEFRIGKFRILASANPRSDLPVAPITINFDMPHDPCNYAGRLHRLGRFGKKTTVITFLTEEDNWETFDRIQTHFKIEIDPMPSDITDFL